METIHLLQAIVLFAALMLVIASEFKTPYDGHLFLGGTTLLVALGISFCFAFPAPIQKEALLAMRHVFPALSEKSLNTLWDVLFAQSMLALFVMNWRGHNRATRIPLTTVRISGEIALGIKIILLSICLIGCQPKAKPAAPTAPPVPTIDSTRIKLQDQADTSRSRADRAADASNSTVTDYETDAKTYDSLRNPL